MDIGFYKKLLLDKQEELNSVDKVSAEARKTVELDQTSVGRLSRMDALQGQAMNQAIAARRKQELLRIESAIKRTDSDEYGYCVQCGEKIVEKRLKFDPAALSCSDCANK